jgi:hypothetical protein
MSDYSIDLNKIRENFKGYQNKSDPNSSSVTTAQEQSANRQFTGQNAWKKYQQENNTPAQEFKTNYADNLTKYMNKSGDNITSTTNTEENKIDQNSGNKGNWNINNNPVNSDQTYANIGNDYSVNIAGIGEGFNNMQGAAAYSALNNNQAKRSASEVNGLKRANQASQQATALVGAKDRASRLYNGIGLSQNYWRRKADAQQNFYLGDIFQQKAPDFELPDSPNDPMDDDKTGDIVDDFKNNLDN